MGVRHPNPTNANMSTVSNLREVRGSEADPDAQAGDDEDDSEEDWQPEDSDESMRGTPTRLPTIDRRSTDQRRYICLPMFPKIASFVLRLRLIFCVELLTLSAKHNEEVDSNADHVFGDSQIHKMKPKSWLHEGEQRA